MKTFTNVGLKDYYSLLPWGLDFKRCYELLKNINKDGGVKLKNLQIEEIKVHINKDVIQKALKLKQGSNNLRHKNTKHLHERTTIEVKRFKHMIFFELVFVLHIHTQHFTLGKPTR